ncbi:DUF6449 domain-containing protein [Cytobacillus dafuensis]|nr:DUF6449 domain-containing protein [Cytobacillus dafuensis]
MQSKISLVNREIWKTLTRSVGWVSIIYFLGQFIAVPLEILMTSSSEEHRKYVYEESLFQFNSGIQVVLNIAIPVLLAVFLFRFLQVRSYSDFMHSLPIRRERIYHQYTLAGCVFLILPNVINAIIIFALYIPLNLADFFTIAEIFKWLGITIMFNLLIYMTGVFVAMITGLSAVQGALTYIILLLPIGLLILLGYNLPFYLYGFPDQYFMANKIESISPLVALTYLGHSPLGTVEIIIYILLIFILYGFSLWVYKRRKLEAVSQALMFPFLKPVFKYGATFCTMLLGGMYFGKMEGGTFWLIAGYLFGAILGYFVAEMVLQKSWRIVIHIKGLIKYAGVMAILVVLFQFDFTQYEKNVPYTSEIERVHFSDSYYLFSDTKSPYYLKEPENIDLVRRLHKEIVSNKNDNKMNGDPAFFAYELKNGKTLVRSYQIDKKEYAHYYKLIHESDEYKRTTNEIFKINVDQIEKITIRPVEPISKKAVIVDPVELKEMISVLKKEIDRSTYEETQNDNGPYSVIEIMQKDDKNISMVWRISYKQFEQWLSQKGLLENARVNASDISKIYIAREEDLDINFARGFSYEEVFDKMEGHPNTLKITDKNKIETILQNASSNIDGSYLVGFYYKEEGTIDIKSFTDKNIPDFVKQYFQ